MAMSNEHEQTSCVNHDDLRNKAVRLFTYLKEVCQLRFVVVRDCRNYDQILWFNEIPRVPECFCIAWSGPTETSEAWIEVHRTPEPTCPPLPAVCKDWIGPEDLTNSAVTPVIRERIPAPVREGFPPSFIEILQKPSVRAKWQEYLKTKWEAWAAEHRRWKNVQQVYGNLFSMYQQQKRLGESFELRVGIGLLCWQTPSGERIYRHILAGQANISFDANRGIITVSAAAEGVKLALEHDMLDPSQLPTPEQHQAIENGIQANAETPWDQNLIEPLLRRWVHAMNERGRYDSGLQQPPTASAIPQVCFAPALILRRRTARTLVKLLSDIAKNIEQNGPIPFGVERLCKIVDDVAPNDDENSPQSHTSTHIADTETYFPLPANEEQSKIAQRLSTGRGVLVQGPPGTGKSHTIANLICHLLAKGKRVLVTSQTPRALKVLQDKIPQELSPLCVSVLGNDTHALKNMENSVLGITERHHDWEAGGKERNAQKIQRLESHLYTGRKRMAEIESRLRQLREQETYSHSVGGGAYQGTASHIAQKLVEDQKRFGWIPDTLSSNQELSLPASSFLAVLRLLRSLQPSTCREVSQPFVAITDLPSVDDFVRLASDERAAKEICEVHSDRKASPAYQALVGCSREERSLAFEKIRELQTAVGNIRRRPQSWIPKATTAVLSDQDRPWRELLEATSRALANLRVRAHKAHARRVELPNQMGRQQILADARDLHEHLNSGGTLGFLFLRSAVVRRTLYVTTQIRVNGRVCATKETLAELVEHLDLEVQVETLWGYWDGLAEKIEGPLPRQVMELEERKEALELIAGLISSLEEAKAAVKNLRGISEPAWHDDNAVASLMADLQAAAAHDEVAYFAAQLAPLAYKLSCAEIRPNAHPVNAVLYAAVKQRDAKAYSEAWSTLRQLTDDKQNFQIRETIFQSIANYAPRLATILAEDFQDSKWDDRLVYILEAWNWSRANTWLHEFQKDQDAEKLENEVKALQKSLQHSLAELAAEKAWQHCFARLTEPQRQHLMAWTAAVRRIGRGTGVRAEIHRRDARMHMDECRGAVPAWIMPFYRLAETIDAKPESFDVVIVDEASQSGPDTLALLYLAKQIIVVGDDQQISPEAVGIQRNDVDLLSQRLISDLPHRDALGVESSLFNQAVIRFGRRIVLREHFRSVPEIIRFSNDLCYTATPLIPLRQYAPERLEPIIVRHVAEGFREGIGSARNRPEANALVEVIIQCTKDPRYNCAKDDHHPYGKMTFGVISLQGEEQAKLINQLLLAHLMPEELEQRELVCGDAYAFQGDERDVIFLSMVAAPNQRFAALVKESDKQRFNVSASRARDQMWLFHTVTLNELNPDDMRYRLLAYCSNPAAQPPAKPDWEKCESEFERNVGKIIHAKNYRLIPQYEPFGSASYRIDFVVEGLKSRIAVECDGPHHDDPEQIQRDMVRQRQLERCKWVFWRVSASSFYFDRDKAMSSLWRKLDELGIHPLGTNISVQPLESVPQANQADFHQNARTQSSATILQIAPQPDLIPSDQMELPDATRATPILEKNGAEAMTVSPALRQYIVTAKQKRTYGVLIYQEIGHVVLELLPPYGRVERDRLVKSVADALEFPEEAHKRINEAIRRLEELNKIHGDANCVWRP